MISHYKYTGTHLVGYFRLDDVTADGITVKWGRGILVPQGMDVLRGTGISQFDARELRRLDVDADSWL